MSKRKYTHIKELLPEIETMIEAGKGHREIKKHLGLTGDRPLHNLLKRKRRRQAKLKAGIIPGEKGRPRRDAGKRDIQLEQAYKIMRLKMENKLLRDFLQSIGRKRGQG